MAQRQPWWTTLLKGVGMGLCDVVPGVSGGTFALIVGIYQRLIDAISGVVDLPKALISSVREKNAKPLTKALKQADLAFLATLFTGILLAILAGSKLVLYLLDRHFAYTISFFIGLIAASAITITKHLKERSLANTTTLILGIAFGLSLLIFAPIAITPSKPYLFLSGFLAISALFLPGVSGSFVLLLLGVYDYLLSLLHEALQRPEEIIIFIFGAALGAAFISKAIHYLFRLNKSRTLYGLLGIVIGSLGVPLRNIIIAGAPSIISCVLFAAIGFFLILLIEQRTP